MEKTGGRRNPILQAPWTSSGFFSHFFLKCILEQNGPREGTFSGGSTFNKVKGAVLRLQPCTIEIFSEFFF